MTEVVTNARQINAFLSDIAVAAKDQANAVSEVGRSILELDQNTQQNAALVEESQCRRWRAERPGRCASK